MFFSLLTSEISSGTTSDIVSQTPSDASLLTQYAFYGAILIVGLIILAFMNRAAKKPVSVLAVSKSEALIKRIEKLLAEQEKKKNGLYILPAKIMQINSEVGDLVVLADREFTQNRNIAYEGVLSCYQAAAAKLGDFVITWDVQEAAKVLMGVKEDLEKSLVILAKITKK